MQTDAQFFASRRAEFPALAQQINSQPAAFYDGPGGSQTPARVGEAMAAYLRHDNANSGGPFPTSRRTDALVLETRHVAAAFLGAARPEEIVFGPNMTSLTFHLAHAVSRQWREGDEIVVTALDHDANVAPWTLAARERGVTVRTWDFHPDDGCRLRLDDLRPLLNSRTRLVALTLASNALGTMPDAAGAIQRVRELAPQALTFLDAVHFAPHGLIDVQRLDTDFLACSAYKFFGPHLGLLYGKHALLADIAVDKVRPSSAEPPGKWETGTPSFESIAGVRACLQYLAELGAEESASAPLADRAAFVRAMRRIRRHEISLSVDFLEHLAGRPIPGLRLHGIADPAQCDERTPTFALTLAGCPPRQLAELLAERGFCVWDGNFYAVNAIERLGLAASGGLVRIGFLHYNTPDESARLMGALTEIAATIR